MALTVAHVTLAMAGYVGLIATNAWLLLLARNPNAETVFSALRAWRRLERIFGPLLGAGLLAGIALAVVSGFSLTSAWLLTVYGLILGTLAIQAAIMVPWQLRAERVVESGAQLSTRPIVLVVVTFSVAYLTIATLMFARP